MSKFILYTKLNKKLTLQILIMLYVRRQLSSNLKELLPTSEPKKLKSYLGRFAYRSNKFITLVFQGSFEEFW